MACMNGVVRARVVLPMAGPAIENGAVRIADRMIRAVGKFDDVRGEGNGDSIDLGDAVLLPGLINTHCHLELTDMVGQAQFDGNFTDWLKRVVSTKKNWQHTEYESSALRGAEMLLRTA